MPYDPNDPNQGSQAPPEDQATPSWQAKNAMTSGTVNDLVRSRPVIAQWLASHNDGRNLSEEDKAQLLQLMRGQGVDSTNLEIDDSGVISWPKHTGRDIALGSLMAFGPIVAAWAVPAIAATAGGGGAAGGAAGAEAGAEVGAGAGAGAGASTAGAEFAGLLPSTTTAAGSAALPAGLEASGAVEAAGAGAGSAFDAAGNFVGDTTYSSTPGTLDTASRIASLAGKTSNLVNGISTAVNGGQDPMLAGTSAANAASQAARNRILAAQVDAAGPAADKTALSNMRTAGLMSNFAGSPASDYGSPAINPGQGTRDFATAFQAELAKRMAAGKSLTLSGVPTPTPQELADEQKARDIANGGSGRGSFVNGVNTGARIAQLVPGVINGVRDIWSMV